MNVAAYVRVSSKAQDLGMQRASIERACAARGDVVTAWYAEKRSGKVLARPELDRLRVEARTGAIRRLYVFRLDRLTRSGIRDTFELIEELRTHGVHLVSISDGFDLDGPAAEVVLAVMAWAAKMERLAINERISAARDRMSEDRRPQHPGDRRGDEGSSVHGRSGARQAVYPVEMTGQAGEEADRPRGCGNRRAARQLVVGVEVPKGSAFLQRPLGHIVGC